MNNETRRDFCLLPVVAVVVAVSVAVVREEQVGHFGIFG
jgi:hypothetical protein